MNLFSGILNGLGEIWAHKLRSFLTVLCVLLGVMSLVLTTGFMEGFFQSWKISLAEKGGLEKISGQAKRVGKVREPFVALSSGYALDDERALRRALPDDVNVSPEVDLKVELKRRGKDYYRRVQGVKNDILAANRYEIAKGRAFSDLEIRDSADVIILGTDAVKNLFDPDAPVLGEFVELNGRPFRVIGVLKHYESLYGDYNWLDFKNRIAFIPVTTALAKINGNRQLTWLNVRTTEVDRLGATMDTIENVLASQHRLVDDFEVLSNEEQLDSFAQTRANFVYFGGGIAGISLLVSGIGIMNLMLASINERVREIGIRKALGATGRNIFSQFIAEAVALSMLGGVLGVGVAVGAITALQELLPPGRQPVLSGSAFVLGFAFSVGVGVLAGLYPALQASKLDPIEALRYE